MEIGDLIATILIIYLVQFLLGGVLMTKYKPFIKLWKGGYGKGKVNPIYKLEKYNFDSHYGILKYELGWREIDSWIILIPFSWIFANYRYGACEKYIGCFEIEDVRSKPISELIAPHKTIGEYYEYEWTKKRIKFVKETKKETDFKDKIDEVNKIFNENY